eukprot:11418614-Alexandrium_andersonii.AAC.1
MSASLVGSEMCIRDRRIAPGLPGLFAAAIASFAGAAGHGALVAHGHGSVSYTHLTLPTICSV